MEMGKKFKLRHYRKFKLRHYPGRIEGGHGVDSSVFVNKLDQIHLLAGAVLGRLEQIDDAGKS
jgi:hypothetical protein